MGRPQQAHYNLEHRTASTSESLSNAGKDIGSLIRTFLPQMMLRHSCALDTDAAQGRVSALGKLKEKKVGPFVCHSLERKVCCEFWGHQLILGLDWGRGQRKFHGVKSAKESSHPREMGNPFALEARGAWETGKVGQEVTSSS